jgi:hypothetical protein
MPSAAELESRHARVGRVEVVVENIFDVSDPREDYWLYRTADALHIKTRQATVRGQLLFASGDEYLDRLLRESERLLRSRVYLYGAWIVPIAYDPGTNTVDLRVTVRDVWTLSPSVSFGRAGGVNGSGIGLQEENLLGTGTRLLFRRSRDVDRTSTLGQVSSESIGATHLRGGISLADSSDGRTRGAYLERPFYALDTPTAIGISARHLTEVDSRYDRGNIVDQFGATRRAAQAYYGWSHGYQGGWVQRVYAGVRADEARFAADPRTAVPALELPADRVLRYPWVALEEREDRYSTTRNRDQIGRTEDFFLGRYLYLELGRTVRALGADRDAWLSRFSASAGWQESDRQAFVSLSGSSRFEDGRADNARLTLAARGYWPQSDRWLLYGQATAVETRRLDADSQVLLGGDTGLRGYPLRFQTGSGSALLTVEERFYSGWYPFRLVRVGGALFTDVGRTWGSGVIGTPSLGLLKDVGVGLRLGNTRSGLGNVLHVDVSWALDAPAGVRRYQVTVQTQASY